MPSNFNPLSPHGERRTRHRCGPLGPGCISIHSPHTGRDRPGWLSLAVADYFNPLSPHGERPDFDAYKQQVETEFQSTLPTRGETGPDRRFHPDKEISIHSPHTGRDQMVPPLRGAAVNFNPLSPHGERHNVAPLSTTSKLISIHSPHTGRDAADEHMWD